MKKEHLMKKHFTLILISAVAFCIAAPTKLLADPGDDPTPIIVIEYGDPSGEPDRSPVQIPIECYYYSTLSSIVSVFLSSLGSVIVEIENLTTGAYSMQLINGNYGAHVIPFNDVSGSYRITFTLMDVTEYIGELAIP